MVVAESDEPILVVNRRASNGGLGLPLSDLPEIKHQKRKVPAKKSIHTWNMIGSDTETIEGKLWLFSTEKGVWECPTFNHLIQILYDEKHCRRWRKSGKAGYVCLEHFFWNLKFDAQAVLRMLHPKVMWDLTASKTTEGEVGNNKVIINADTGNYTPEVNGRMIKLSYLEGKSLTFTPIKWRRGKAKLGVCKWWDISQFYGKMRLNNAAKKYLNKSKIEKCFDGTILDASRFDEKEYREYYKDDINKYAIVDAVLAGELARRKRTNYVENDIRFIEPYSLANVAQRNLLDTCKIPTINDMKKLPNTRFILQAAQSSYRGGWFETVGAGYHPDIQGIDLASAYPYIMHHLPDLTDTKGAWFIGDKEEEWLDWMKIRKPFEVGFCEIQILFSPDLPIHPLAQMSRTGTIVTPRLVRGWFSAEEIAEAIKWPHLSIYYGTHCFFLEDEKKRPFAPFIENHYEIKMNSEKGSVEYDLAKIMLNSTYGKTIQAIGGSTGKLWNPCYAATITGATRARIGELLRVNDFAALSVATDGLLFPTQKLSNIPNRPLPSPHNLGQWELEERGELALLMSGVYSVNTEENYTKTVYRGSASLFLKGDYPRGLFSFCETHRNERQMSTTIRRPYSAGEARMRNNMDLMNIFAPHSFTIKPAGDSTKRLWGVDKPAIFGDLLTDWYANHPHQVL